MDNVFDTMRTAIQNARMALRAADSVTDDMVRLVVGRLRKVHTWLGKQALSDLKRELKDWNAHTKKWKD